MAWGNGAPRGWPGISPSMLNDVYSFGQFFVPAGAMTPTEGLPSILTTKTTTGGGLHHTHTVMEFVHTVKSGCSFDWAFKADFVKSSVATINLRCGVLYFTPSSADTPNNIIRFDIGAVNLAMGDDINVGTNLETNILTDVQPTATPGGEELLNGGDTGSKQNVPLTTINGLVGTELSPTNWNFLTINMEREALDENDTFQDSAFVFGMGVQFAVEFSNVAEWPD